MSHNGKKQRKPTKCFRNNRLFRKFLRFAKSRVYVRTSFTAHIVAYNSTKCNSIYIKKREKSKKTESFSENQQIAKKKPKILYNSQKNSVIHKNP